MRQVLNGDISRRIITLPKGGRVVRYSKVSLRKYYLIRILKDSDV